MLNLGIKLTELGIIPESVLRIAIKKIIQQRLLEIPNNTEFFDDNLNDRIEKAKKISIKNNNDNKNIDIYNQLIEYDQYLAWTYFWKNDINHIAIDLSTHPDNFNEIIENMEKDINLKMNSDISDDKFQISFDGHLTQCSTKSDYSENIPKSYIEFVHREILPCNKTKLFPSSIHRKDGFDALNANTIFKSTDI